LLENCILIVHTLDNWREADGYRFWAETKYGQAVHLAKQHQDPLLIQLLKPYRAELDKLFFKMHWDQWGEDNTECEDFDALVAERRKEEKEILRIQHFYSSGEYMDADMEEDEAEVAAKGVMKLDISSMAA
jgi:hypothetical protein